MMMMNKEKIQLHIYWWLASNRPDMLQGERRDKELEGHLYTLVVDELINDNFVSFKGEKDIFSAEPSVVFGYINIVLAQHFGRSIYAIVDSVWSEEYPDSYNKRKELGILTTEIIAYVNSYERKGITIDNILDSPIEEGLSKMEAFDNGVQFLSEEQFRQVVTVDLLKDENAK